MKTIFKYTLPATTPAQIVMPTGATILVAQNQAEAVVIWAEVDTDLPLESRTFVTAMTGQTLPRGKKQFLGTVQLAGGALVFHVYEML